MRMVIKLFNHTEEYAVGLILLALALYSCVQVFTRYVLSYSFTSYEEVARYSCILCTFLGASLGIKYFAHFAMTALTDRLPYRLKCLTSALVWLMSATFFFVVAYYGYVQCQKQWRFGTMTPALRIPMYVPFLPIPVFFAIMGCRSLIRVGKEMGCLIRGDGKGHVES